MGLFEHWPYTNFHDLNLDWIIKQVQTLTNKVETLSEEVGDVDVTQAVNDKIDSMVQDGTIQAFFDQKQTTSGLSTGTLQAIWECIKSYLRNKSNLAYHTTEGGDNAWNYENGPAVVQDEFGNTGLAINCSSFLHLIMAGVPYEYSMYNAQNGKHNIFGAAGYCYNIYGETVTADNYTNYRFVRQMLPRFFDLGLAEYTNDDFSNIGPGDILFFTNTGIYQADKATHIAIVLSPAYIEYEFGSTKGMYLIAECVSESTCIVTRVITCENLVSRGVFAVAHPIWQHLPERPVEKLMDVKYFSGGSFNDARAYDDLYAMDIVTLDFDYEPSAATCYFNMRVNGQNPISSNGPRYATTPPNTGALAKRHHTLIYNLRWPGDAYDPITAIRVYNTNGTGGELTNFKMFRGIGTIENEFKDAETADTLAEIQTAIQKHLTSIPTMANTDDFKLPIKATSAITVGSSSLASGSVTIFNVEYSTTSSAITAKVTAGSISGTWNGSSWTWA